MSSSVIDKLYAVTDKGPIRARFPDAGVDFGGVRVLGSDAFCRQTSSLEIWEGLLLIWAVCAGVIHGFGFRPQRSLWRAFFAPLPAIVILCAGLLYVSL